jgi:hypothetical protein
MRRLVETWIEAEKSGYRNTLGRAVKELNLECSIKLTYSRQANGGEANTRRHRQSCRKCSTGCCFGLF